MKLLFLQKIGLLSLTALMIGTLAAPAALAKNHHCNYNKYSSYSNYGYDNRPGTAVGRYFYQHPIIKKAAIGAGSGALLGALLSHDNRGGGALKGAVIGSLAGGAFGYAQNRGYLGGSRGYYQPSSYYGPQGYYQPSSYYRPQNAYYKQPYAPYYGY